MNLNCILLGAPGAGKGTQAQVLSRLWRVPHISTGAMLRDAVRAGTPLGKRVEPIVASGGLIADDLMLGVVAERLNLADARTGFILDGFPRTIQQARALDWLVAERDPLLIINVAVPDSHILERLSTRGREDDAEHVVRQRLAVYHRETEPLVQYYAQRATFHSVNGAQPLGDVTAAILRAAEQPQPARVARRAATWSTMPAALPVS